MRGFFIAQKRNNIYRGFCSLLACVLSLSLVLTPSSVQAQTVLNLPVPGTMIQPSPAFVPVLLKGMTIHPDDPLKFDFIIDSGNTHFTPDQVKEESERLVKYFLASMTVPKDDLWVNLSPNEPERIIPNELGKTELGRDMLAQDYILKQLTASLMYPEKELGKKFWDKIYKEAEEKFGTFEIPVNTFNKVWIVPEMATVYEHEQTVYIVDAHLKVMLDEDYMSRKGQAETLDSRFSILDSRNPSSIEHPASSIDDQSSVSTSIIREIIIPAIEREVNEGEHFAPLRQIYHSLILAKWYKETVKNSLLSQVYADKNLIDGVNSDDPDIKDKVYAQYMEAYKKGVFNYIKEDYVAMEAQQADTATPRASARGDRLSQVMIPRKYFSGGLKIGKGEIRRAGSSPITVDEITKSDSNGQEKFQAQVGVIGQKDGVVASPIFFVGPWTLDGARKVLDSYLVNKTEGYYKTTNAIRIIGNNAEGSQKDAEHLISMFFFKEPHSFTEEAAKSIQQVAMEAIVKQKNRRYILETLLEMIPNEIEEKRGEREEYLSKIIKMLTKFNVDWGDQTEFLKRIIFLTKYAKTTIVAAELLIQDGNKEGLDLLIGKIKSSESVTEVPLISELDFVEELKRLGASKSQIKDVILRLLEVRRNGYELYAEEYEIGRLEIARAYLVADAYLIEASGREYKNAQLDQILAGYMQLLRAGKNVGFINTFLQEFGKNKEALFQINVELLDKKYELYELESLRKVIYFLLSSKNSDVPDILGQKINNTANFLSDSNSVEAHIYNIISDALYKLGDSRGSFIYKYYHGTYVSSENPYGSYYPDVVVETSPPGWEKTKRSDSNKSSSPVLFEKNEFFLAPIFVNQNEIDIIDNTLNTGSIDITSIVDPRLIAFLELLKKTQLDKDVILAGGAVRDAILGKKIADIDFTVQLPLNDNNLDSPNFKPLSFEMYEKSEGILKRLSEALGITVNQLKDDQNPVKFQGLKLEYLGPREGKTKDIIYRGIVFDKISKKLSFAVTAPEMLLMALDSDGKLYSYEKALKNFLNGRAELKGDLKQGINLWELAILKLFRLRHQFGLGISASDYNLVQKALERQSTRGKQPFDKVETEIQKILEVAEDKGAAKSELRGLGFSIPNDGENVNPDQSKISSPISSKEDLGGIDMNNINVDRQGGGVNIQFDPVAIQDIIDAGITGFTPVIINITPLPSVLPLLGLAPNKEEEFELSSLN